MQNDELQKQLRELGDKAADSPGLKAAIDEKEAAFYIGMSVQFLRQGRCYGNLPGRTPAPPFIKIGRSVRYLIRDLDAWLEEHRVTL